ncbi:hypothetical protein GCM10023220_11130 [Streptomyces ziwulingensis]|uniref:Tetratricopeptide repeat protein n=2 Tax=Streptomyces ziwulingensis TaxID=1045501 RepID=A0ABP9B1T3_9ACTN
MQDAADVPAWPVYDLTVHEDGRVLVSGPLVPTSGHATRAAALDVVAHVAAGLGRAVRATAAEPGGAVWRLIVSPEGEVSEVPDSAARATGPKRRRSRRRGRSAATGATATSPTAADAPAISPPPVGTPAAGRTAVGVPVTGTTVTGATPPGSSTPLPASAARREPQAYKEPQAYPESLEQVENHLAAGRADRAGALAALLDTRATATLGVSHPDTLRIREVRARATALAGDPVGGIQLYRDVAERWHYRGNAEQAEAVASRAERLWKQIPQVDEALTAGVAVIRMRSQMPGPGGDALTAVLAHRESLLRAYATANTPAPLPPPPPEPAVDKSPAPQKPRATMSWERPAVDDTMRLQSAG